MKRQESWRASRGRPGFRNPIAVAVAHNSEPPAGRSYVHFRVHGRAAVAETDSKAIENLAILASHLECIGACIITIAAS